MQPLDELIELSHRIGDRDLDAVILGEGNTSIRADDATFWVKGSGCNLASMGAADFVRLRFAPILALLDEEGVDEARLQAVYAAAKADPAQPRRPSVEALFHALCLQQPGVRVVAHSHPTAVNALTCSREWPAVLAGRMFPDEAVVLGPDSVFIPYVDPGVVLARAIRDGLAAYRARYGAAPKVVYMQNHGLIALAGSPTEALNITAMAIKAARIRQSALHAGGIATLDAAVVGHLLGRPDEVYRMAALAGR